MLALLAVLAVGCAEGEGGGVEVPPGENAPDLSIVDLSPTGDLAGTILHLRWSIVWNGKPATCAEAGVARVGLRAWRDPAPRAQWDCAAGQAVTDLLDGANRAVVALDKDGAPLDYFFLNPAKYHSPGDVDAPVELHITDEPVPQLQSLFALVAGWYKARGALPPAAAWSPGPPGLCCNYKDVMCPDDRVELRSRPWLELGFVVGHESHFSYLYQPLATSPPSFEVRAGTDLNCNARTFSDYRLAGTWNGGAFDGADGLMVVNPGE